MSGRDVIQEQLLEAEPCFGRRRSERRMPKSAAGGRDR